MRESASRCALASMLLACCLFQASCAPLGAWSGVGRGRPGPRGVEFVGVYQDRAELVPGLRGARSIRDLKQLLDESDRPGGTNIRARFRVVRVVSGSDVRLRPGDRVTVVFRSRKGLGRPPLLPKRLVGSTLRVVMHDPFTHRYYGRFSYFESREASPSFRTP